MRISSTVPVRGLTAGLVLTLASGLAVGLGTVSSAGAASADRATDTVAAREALSDARAALGGRADGREATMALRDLWRTKDALPRSEEAAADRLLSRPTSPGDDDYYGAGVTPESACGDHVCVHWAETGEEASDPAYAADVLETMEEVHETYVAAGYKPTLPDDGQGGTTQPDIYLAEIGDVGLYGYCTTDAPDYTAGSAVYAYCVLDNDYAADEFPSNTPFENMQVTAAHEYFHAIQFAYDADDDGWVYETTATWAEDELFDDVNDNWNYLPYGQMGSPSGAYGLAGPQTPLDIYDFAAYGNWVFFRFLTEAYTEEQGGMPTLVRDVWDALDTTGEPNDLYSVQAVRQVLTDRGTSMREQYAAFALGNNTPARTYEEGAAYPRPARAFRRVELPAKRPAVTRRLSLDHLTSGTGVFKPTRKGQELQLRVNMTKRSRGAAAAVAVKMTDGTLERTWLELADNGNGRIWVPFDKRDVKRVEVTLVNTSSEMTACGSDPEFWFSCSGVAVHDDQEHVIKARSFYTSR